VHKKSNHYVAIVTQEKRKKGKTENQKRGGEATTVAEKKGPSSMKQLGPNSGA